MIVYASGVPIVHRASTAAYVGAKCGNCPGPPKPQLHVEGKIIIMKR